MISEYEKANDKASFMNTMTSCMNKVVMDGYTDTFKVTDEGLFSCKTENKYEPEQIKIVNFYRFEGESDPADMSILYVIETHDGAKGTLTDAYGAYADENVNKFIEQVNDINKRTEKRDKKEC